jgi:hypothetical protein
MNNKIKFAILPATLAMLTGGSIAVAAEPYYSGVVIGTSSTSCGMQLGEYGFVQYVQHDEISGLPAKLLIQNDGASVYLENKSLTAEFDGTGKVAATVIFNFASERAPAMLKTNGTYKITMDSSDPNMLKLDPLKITIAVPDLGPCQFNVRGVLTPSPIP